MATVCASCSRFFHARAVGAGHEICGNKEVEEEGNGDEDLRMAGSLGGCKFCEGWALRQGAGQHRGTDGGVEEG
eukprot:CAMPEP_0174357394 /NCGR_PEP_ID=MMETSP0811_2-20130205/35861_1 /TAXON_ID=73025 ORGANISM="Eutreptiella gymnastica-like, Strain CCMP1594" /NCGR_SAMPLE_ID=MMETSP0811_2 /ASSEMBLY_ACC=CAM_ASM_000667 /LENGTH=73 /DNA_ID=CAMNT_0015490187 /DNA_START=1225 /DNA_END=1446 /DNA_ORIENTATION=+